MYSNVGVFRNFLRKKYTLTMSMLSKTLQSKFTLMKREMGKNGDQGESSKSQRTTRISSPSAEASLPRSLCSELCMICKKKNLKVEHSHSQN